tara:strand:+ start:70 stop:303 length:234 start_codon:yes stop_codon:yes gene_type:complete
MDNNIRNETTILLKSYFNNDINKSNSAEKGIYNYSVNSANKKGVNIDWNNDDFKSIYYNKLISTIEIILLGRKLDFN